MKTVFAIPFTLCQDRSKALVEIHSQKKKYHITLEGSEVTQEYAFCLSTEDSDIDHTKFIIETLPATAPPGVYSIYECKCDWKRDWVYLEKIMEFYIFNKRATIIANVFGGQFEFEAERP